MGYHNTPAATAPLVTATAGEGEEATQRVILNPYSGAYNPYWYNGLYNHGGYPGYGYGGYRGYGAYPYGAGAWNGAYGGYPGYGFGYGAHPYGAGAWNYAGLPQFVPAVASEAAPAPAAAEYVLAPDPRSDY